LLTLLLLLKLSCCLEIITRVDKEGVSHIDSFLIILDKRFDNTDLFELCRQSKDLWSRAVVVKQQ
jgi:hypothetical protein